MVNRPRTDGVLNGLMYQRLMPILCPHCKRKLIEHPDAISDELWQRLRLVYQHGEIDGVYLRGDGCEACDGIGLIGLQVAAEVISATDRNFLAFLQAHIAHALSRIASGEVDPAIAEERLGVTLDHDFLREKGQI